MNAAAGAYLDEQEERSWSWRLVSEKAGEEARNTGVGVVEIVEHLMSLCDNNIDQAMAAFDAWSDAASERYRLAGEEERAMHVMGLQLSILMNGVGNLFGMIPTTAPNYDDELAAVGRARGWRK